MAETPREALLTKRDLAKLAATSLVGMLLKIAGDAAASALRAIPFSGALKLLVWLGAALAGSLWATVPAVLVFVLLRRHVASTTQEQAARQRDHLLMAADLIEARLKAIEGKTPSLESAAGLAASDLVETGHELKRLAGDIQTIHQDLLALKPLRRLSALLLEGHSAHEKWTPFPGSLPSEDHNAILLGCHLGACEIQDVGTRLEWRRTPL